MALAEFSAFLKLHCHGDWWDRVGPFAADPEWGDCEACDRHPLSSEQAELLNTLLGTIRDAGGPAPAAVYPHCCGELFAEWHGPDPAVHQVVCLDITNRFGRDALVSLPGKGSYFVHVGDT